jgi:hypothetical protein
VGRGVLAVADPHCTDRPVRVWHRKVGGDGYAAETPPLLIARPDGLHGNELVPLREPDMAGRYMRLGQARFDGHDGDLRW